MTVSAGNPVAVFITHTAPVHPKFMPVYCPSRKQSLYGLDAIHRYYRPPHRYIIRGHVRELPAAFFEDATFHFT